MRLLSRRSILLSLLPLSFIPFGTAQATTFVPLTVAQQSAKADVIVTATVASVDYGTSPYGYPITSVSLLVEQTLRGSVRGTTVLLGLAGGYVGEAFDDFGDPRPTVGERVLLFGRSVNDGGKVLMLGGPQSLFFESEGVATDAAKNPIIDPGCEGTRLIARPASVSPRGETDAREDGIKWVTPNDRIFVEEPTSHGLPWAAFLGHVADCVARQPASAGSSNAVGGEE